MRERGFYVWLEHPELGLIPHDGVPCLLSETPGVISSPAPLLGEHTGKILTEILGLSPDEIADLMAAGVLD